jgi:hypothetical protein
VCGGKDVDVLPAGLSKAPHLKTVDVMPVLVDLVTHTLSRPSQGDPCIQSVHVGRRDGSRPGSAKEALEFQVVVLSHLLV